MLGSVVAATDTTVQSAATPANYNDQFTGVLIFGGAVVLILTLVFLVRRDDFNTSFGRIYALLALASLAVALAFANIASEAKTAAFTLLGTIAGYLAGAKASETTETTTSGAPGDGGGGGQTVRTTSTGI
jgi:hypothetical protein